MQLVLQLKVDGHFRQQQRVAQRDQGRCLFSAVDTGDPRDRERVAFFELVCRDERKGRGAEDDAARRGGLARGVLLGRHVDHRSAAGGVDVRQPLLVLVLCWWCRAVCFGCCCFGCCCCCKGSRAILCHVAADRAASANAAVYRATTAATATAADAGAPQIRQLPLQLRHLR
jgi:hypothetical protein